MLSPVLISEVTVAFFCWWCLDWALLEIPLIACPIIFLVSYSDCIVCFCLLLLAFPKLHTNLASSSSGFQNCLRLWILFFLSLLVIWSPCPGWQLYSLLSCLVLLLSTMLPNLPMPNPSMFYNNWNFWSLLCWIFHEVYMHLIYWSSNLMLQNDAFPSLCG